MGSREQKVQELMESLSCLKRHGALHRTGTVHFPRVTPSQWGVLMLIEEMGKSTVKYVANALGISSSAATQLIDGLVKSGYVHREANAEDRRTTQLVLSKKTKTQVEKMKKQVTQHFLAMFEVLSDRELSQYLSLNKKIVEKLSKK